MKNTFDMTIVVPCYNCRKYVEEMMNSLLHQSYDFQKIEVLLINDGSSDGTLSFIQRYQRDNVIIIDKENEGVSATRNLGIQKARGKYILFLDPDDYLAFNSVQAILQFFDAHYEEVDLVTYPIIWLYPNGNKKMHPRYSSIFGKKSGVFDLKEHYTFIQTTVNVCIKNDKENYFDTSLKYGEDEAFNTSILMKKEKIGYVFEAGYYYRRHQDSITAHKQEFDFEKIYRFYDTFLEKYHNHPYIQSTILNNFRWRIEEGCLYPKGLSLSEANEYVKSITKRLSHIDFSLYKEDFPKRIFLHFLALSGQKIVLSSKEDGEICLKIGDKIILDSPVSENSFYQYRIDGDTLSLQGKLITSFFYEEGVKLFCEKVFQDKTIVTEEIPLSWTLAYCKTFERRYQVEVSLPNTKEISFFLLRKNGEKLILGVKAEQWCSKSKVLAGYYIEIGQKILIRRSNLLRSINSKLISGFHFKFFLLQVMSLFSFQNKKATLYFSTKNSLVYEEYERDTSPHKVFCNKANGLQYKLLLLRCQKLITDEEIAKVIPFGGMRAKYVQASRFIVENR